MKSPAILFSFPLLVTLLAAQSRGQTADVSSAAAPVAEDCCPARKAEPTGGTRARVETGESERMHLKIRGQRRPVEVMSGQVFVQSRNGKERVHRFAGGKGVAGASREAVRLREFSKGADEVSLVAYHPDRPRTEDHMFLVSAAVNVRLMEGVDRKVFFAASGALRAKRMDFAPDALVLDYASAAEAIEAAEMLSEMPGVLSASQVIAVKRMPEFLPNEQYFSPTGPNYNPPPQTDNVDGHTCPANLCGMVPTSGYAWWANNRASLIRPSPRRLGPGPVNSVASQLDLGDLPPIPYDPLFPKLQGEMSDIRLPLAWENRVSTVERVSGFNQKILIIDDGIVSKHPDLGAALGAAQAVDLLNTHHINMYTRQNSAEPEEPQFDAHGTGLAGIVAARKNSSDFAGGAGIVGVAPRSTLQSVVGIKRFIRDDRWAEAFAYGTTQTDTDGDGNFWEHKRSGMVDFDICLNASSEQGSGSAVDLFPEDYLWHQAINFGATEQRAYKGVIYVTSAGNGAGGGGGGHMNVNYMEQKNSIYQIPVGGVSDLGRRIGRSNAGAALVCVAPTWGDELPPVFRWPNAPAGWPRVGHLTAPLPISVEPALPFFKNPPVGPDDLPTAWRRVTQGITTLGPTTKSSTGLLTYSHTFDFTGTSASAAQVAGIVALMLEINPALSYRDVKEILLRSSRVVNDVRVNTLAAIAPASNPNALWPTQWRMSSLGRPLNHAFGAGLIDANRAIKIARLWTNLPIEPRSIVPVNFDPDKPAYEKVITQRDRHTGGIYIPKPSSELIPTNGTWKEIIIPPPISGMRLEHIEVRIRLYHHRRGDLEIKLVAPQDINWDAEMPEPMESVLFAPHRDDSRTSYYDGPPPAGQTFNASNTPTDWTFTTLRHWGTVAGTGQWKLMIRDAVQLGTSNTPVQVTVPDKDTGDSSFISRQKLDGIAVTYHGAASVTNINNPPEVSKSLRLSFSAGPTPRVTLLKANVGSSGAGGAVPFPVTSWDMYDSSEICPIQPSNPTRAPFEFFPPGWRLEGDTSVSPVLVPLTTLRNNQVMPLIPPEWPQRQHPPTWIDFFDPPPLNVPPLAIPTPLTAESEGAQGALSLRPPWVTDQRLTTNRNHIIFRDPKNKNDATNFIHARLNRATGGLEVIPVNTGRYTISVYAENLLGLSKVAPIAIQVTPSSTYAGWATLFWGGDDLGDPCTSPVSGYSADPDGDGLQNALEYTMRLDPTVADKDVWPFYTIEGNNIVFRWSRDLSTPDMVQSFETSVDLVNWTPVTPISLSTSNNFEQLEHRLPLSPATRTFVRLRAEPTVPCP